MEGSLKNEKKSRQRGENWTYEEKELLLKIMRYSMPIIESKLADTNTNRRKNHEWLRVQKKLQELSGKKRDIAQLKGFWRRLKSTAKKNYSQHKKAIKIIDGNHQPLSPSDDDQLIVDLCPTDFIIDKHELDSSDEIFLSRMSEQDETTRIYKDLEMNNDSKIYEKMVSEDKNPLMEDIIKDDDINSKDVMQRTEIKSEENPDDLDVAHESNKKLKIESNYRAIIETSVDFKSKQIRLMEEEYSMKIKYQRKELLHQEMRHKLEINILLLEKEKKELEIKALKKSLE